MDDIRKRIFLDSDFVEEDENFFDETIDDFFNDIKNQIDLHLLIEFYKGETEFSKDEYITLMQSSDFLGLKRLTEIIIFAKYVYSDICELAFSKESHAKIFCSSIKMEETLFLTLCKYGIANKIQRYFSNNELNKGLFLACEEGRTEAVIILLEYNPKLGILNDCLKISSKNGYPKIAELLLNKGANVENALDGQYNVIEMLLNRGINIDMNNGDMLTSACLRGDLKTVKMLEKRGADIDIEAIIAASRNGHLPIVEFLCEKKVNIHKREDSALRLASYNGHYSVVRFLLENYNNFTGLNVALEHASKEGHFSIVQLLFNNGANNMRHMIAAAENGNYVTTQEFLKKDITIAIKNRAFTIACHNGQYSVVKLLLDNGVKVNDDSILRAVSNKHYDVSYLLLEHGANYNAQDLFSIACEDGNYEFVKTLINLGSEEKDKGLLDACKQGHKNIVELLLENGVNVHIDKDRALLIASSQGFVDILKVLFRKDNFSQRSLDSCLEVGLGKDVVNFLLEKGAEIDPTEEKSSREIKIKTENQLADMLYNEKYSEFAYNLQYINNNSVLYNLLRFSIHTNFHGAAKIILNKNPDIVDEYIVMYSVKHNNQRMVEYFLECGIVDKQDAILEAIEHGYYEIVKMLSNNYDIDNQQFLVESIKNNRNEITLFLLKQRGIIPNEQTIEMAKKLNKDEALAMIYDHIQV